MQIFQNISIKNIVSMSMAIPEPCKQSFVLSG